jgi:hypothetical protein
LIVFLICNFAFLFWYCGEENPPAPENNTKLPEHDKRYGIYSLELANNNVELIFSSDNSLHRIQENHTGTKIVFREDFGSNPFHDSEICMINTDGTGYQ